MTVLYRNALDCPAGKKQGTDGNRRPAVTERMDSRFRWNFRSTPHGSESPLQRGRGVSAR
ncbi:hypothetical protein J2850_001379 [Azospirillum picis]|uniref:Transposase n=1 Tax=Azospirillum picis TaxID=488438 RepID=A0ABU0MFN6_9PROT|nr:hypothetical protein [Azospirillum picis]MDQ0532255.1 hypothetical protein [Azospirillum picis]